jgi:hypothetical protein
VHVVVPAAASVSAIQPTAPRRAFREGTILDGIAGATFHAVDGTLFVSVDATPPAERRRVYRVHEDTLVALPHELPAAFARSAPTLVGRYPDKLFAFVFAGMGDHVTFQWSDHGWIEKPVPLPVWRATWWSGQLIGFVSDPAHQAFGRFPMRLFDAGPPITIPAATGPACDKFFAHATSFPKLIAQPAEIYGAGAELFVVGYGCDSNATIVAFNRGSSAPVVHGLAQRTFMDDRYGGVLQGDGATRWFWMPSMGSSRKQALWRFVGTTWSPRPFPHGDAEEFSTARVTIDEAGALWVVVTDLTTQTSQLFTLRGETWTEKKLPADCALRDVSVAERTSLWLACADRVMRWTR